MVNKFIFFVGLLFFLWLGVNQYFFQENDVEPTFSVDESLMNTGNDEKIDNDNLGVRAGDNDEENSSSVEFTHVDSNLNTNNIIFDNTQNITVQSQNSFDAIGGYFDEGAIAPEDEVPQNNFIDSIGYDDPTTQDPSSEPLNSVQFDDEMMPNNPSSDIGNINN